MVLELNDIHVRMGVRPGSDHRRSTGRGLRVSYCRVFCLAANDGSLVRLTVTTLGPTGISSRLSR
jgi:hypothetical protein